MLSSKFKAYLRDSSSTSFSVLTHSLLPHSPSSIDRHKALIDRVLSHYQQYFDEKSRLASLDVFLLFSPTWLSSYVRTLLWIADYKPTLILRLIDGAVRGLTAEQKESLEKLKNETKREERLVTETMATLQESVAGPSVVKSARRVGKLSDGDISELDSAIEVVKRGAKGVLEKADELRVSTVRKLVEILSPPQTVQFLAAAVQFQLRVRKWGLQRQRDSSESQIQR